VSDTVYRCLNCLDHTITREYDVSHLSVTCEGCGEFGRFVHQAVYDQYRSFEESPPADFAWAALDRTQKFVVAEGLARSEKTLDDFEVDAEPTE
jgi:DNA-directed RNA polymerase subunit RPC12/RpoP